MFSEEAQLYLDLLKRCLSNLIYQDPPISPHLAHDAAFDTETRLSGKDWPSQAHTMIGLRRLENIQQLTERILQHEIPGDLLEAGVARGGATIFMRGLLKAYHVRDRVVWVADSFKGALPDPGEGGLTERSYSSPQFQAVFAFKERYPDQFQAVLSRLSYRTSYEEVQENFERYGLLDEHVQFLRGWFCDTLPEAPITRLALLRIDGDLYDSTRDVLKWLYPKLSTGGYVIIDDYHSFVECQQAVNDYLEQHREEVDLQYIDDEAVYWRKIS